MVVVAVDVVEDVDVEEVVEVEEVVVVEEVKGTLAVAGSAGALGAEVSKPMQPHNKADANTQKNRHRIVIYLSIRKKRMPLLLAVCSF